MPGSINHCTDPVSIETARASRRSAEPDEVLRVRIIIYGVGVPLKYLGLAIKRHPLSKERVRWELRPWIVQAALDRLGGRILTLEEQREVWSMTHQRDNVQWPAWWSEKG